MQVSATLPAKMAMMALVLSAGRTVLLACLNAALSAQLTLMPAQEL